MLPDVVLTSVPLSDGVDDHQKRHSDGHIVDDVMALIGGDRIR